MGLDLPPAPAPHRAQPARPHLSGSSELFNLLVPKLSEGAKARLIFLLRKSFRMLIRKV